MSTLENLAALYAETSPGEWSVSSGWEQCDPGVFLYAKSPLGDLIYAPDEDDEKSSGKNLSLQDASFLAEIHNAFPEIQREMAAKDARILELEKERENASQNMSDLLLRLHSVADERDGYRARLSELTQELKAAQRAMHEAGYKSAAAMLNPIVRKLG